MLFVFGFCFGIYAAQDELVAPSAAPVKTRTTGVAATRSSSGSNQATYNANCELGKSYFVLSQECGPRVFDSFWEIDCDSEDVALLHEMGFCIEKSTDDTQQAQATMTVASTKDLESLMDVTSKVAGTGWGVSLTASAKYMKDKAASSHSVSFYKTSQGDSYERKIKYTERLKLNEAAKKKLLNDPSQFVADYGTHFISKIIYSNYFIGSVNVKQTTSESSTALGMMAGISAKALFEASASLEFSSASRNSDIDVQYDASYNGPKMYDLGGEGDEAQAIEAVFKLWQTDMLNAVDSNEDYAKPTRMVFSPWAELAEVQLMFAETGLPAALSANGPSDMLQDFLHRDTIRTQADIRAISNLLSWECVGTGELYAQLLAIQAKLKQHQGQLQDIVGILDEIQSMMAGGEDCDSEEMMDGAEDCDPDISWFIGYTGELIGEVNDLMMHSKDCNKRYKTTDFTIQAAWEPVRNELFFESDAFLTGFHFTAGGLNLKAVGLEGETIGYQEIVKAKILTPTNEEEIEDETRRRAEQAVEGEQVSLDILQFYQGGLNDKKANFEMKCPEESFVDAISATFSEAMCACATHGAGYIGLNQRQCTNGHVSWCQVDETCDKKRAVVYEDIDQLCLGHRRRFGGRLDPMPETNPEVLVNANTKGDLGRVTAMSLHCTALPAGSYGLPSKEPSTHGPYRLLNRAGKTAENSCPEGSAVFKIDWIGVARAENVDEFAATYPTDPAWALASEIRFWCRDFGDFKA